MQNDKDIQITTAHEINNNIEQKLKKIFGKDIKIIKLLDPSVIGGIRIQIDDKVYDTTIKSQLEKLAKSIN